MPLPGLGAPTGALVASPVFWNHSLAYRLNLEAPLCGTAGERETEREGKRGREGEREAERKRERERGQAEAFLVEERRGCSRGPRASWVSYNATMIERRRQEISVVSSK